MSFFTKTELENRASKQYLFSSYDSIYGTEETRITESINKSFSQFEPNKSYDIFLSHSYKDQKAILGLLDILKNDFGYSVYVDWIEDKSLDRTKVNKETAKILKFRMKNCRCLLYATSENASDSKWMPWETGLMDGLKGKVAICPFISDSSQTFSGQEYLSIYPYVDKAAPSGETNPILWVNENKNEYISFDSWLNGMIPHIHQ